MLVRSLTVAFTLISLVRAADWVCAGGDPQQSGWQRRGKLLSVHSVGGLQLLWKCKLASRLTAPVILGRIVTSRGIKELVIVGGSSDAVYAVDADLGTLFWERKLGTAPAEDCSRGLTAAPVLAPNPRVADESGEDDSWEAVRALYVLASGGKLYTLHAGTGADLAPAVTFLPSNARGGNLKLWNGSIYTATSGGCGGVEDAVWRLDLSDPGKGPAKAQTLDETCATCAMWEDAAHTSWTYTTAHGKLEASAGSVLKWTSQESVSAAKPVITGGVVFALGETAGHAVLYAFDALTGRRLYSSGNAVNSVLRSSGLAVANGHVCFGTADNTLYCFGFPIEN